MSATYHIAALTHPEPVVAWAAVAVNVALARFLGGNRDFVPDVIEVLRANDAPDALLAAIRRVPLPAGAADPDGLSAPGQALADAAGALRLAYHEPLLERGLAALAAGGRTVAAQAGLAGGLLGARDGVAAIPPSWTAAIDAPRLAALGARLVTRTAARA